MKAKLFEVTIRMTATDRRSAAAAVKDAQLEGYEFIDIEDVTPDDEDEDAEPDEEAEKSAAGEE